MRIIFKHTQSQCSNIKRYYGSNIINVNNTLDIKIHIRNFLKEYGDNEQYIKNLEIIIIPKKINKINNLESLEKCLCNKRIFYTNKDTYISQKRDEIYPAGMLFYVKLICNYIYHMRDIKDIIFMIDLLNTWDCGENVDAYMEFFNGNGIVGIDLENDENIFKCSLRKVPFLFEFDKDLQDNINESKLVEFMRIFETYITDVLNKTDCVMNYNLSENFFTIKNSINKECQELFDINLNQNKLYKNKLKIIIHARSPCHFMNIEESKYYDCLIQSVINIKNKTNKDVVCIIFGDSKYSINQIKHRLSNENIDYFIFNEDRTDLSK